MNEIQEKWVQALRSGRYEQTRQALRKGDNEFCCLGVLCAIYAQETGEGRWSEPKPARVAGVEHDNARSFSVVAVVQNVDGTEVSHWDLNWGLPPTQVMEWAGLSLDAAHALAGANDSGETFGDIADRIEHDNFFGATPEINDAPDYEEVQ